MALFGKLESIKKQAEHDKFKVAFGYLEKALEEGTEEYKRLLSYPVDAFEKIDLDKNNFALEQIYFTKERSECFFESHRKYIDVQFILEGEEIIEVTDIDNVAVNFLYDENMDLIKYDDTKNNSMIILQKGDVAIFYPDDAHMPCIELDKSTKVVKTVVKVLV